MTDRKERTQLTERFLRQASLLRELQLPITGHSQVEGNKNRILDSRNKEPAPRHREGSTRGRFRRIRRFGFFVAWCQQRQFSKNLARLKFDVQLDHPVPAFADKEHFGSGIALAKENVTSTVPSLFHVRAQPIDTGLPPLQPELS